MSDSAPAAPTHRTRSSRARRRPAEALRAPRPALAAGRCAGARLADARERTA
ncbi:hypothetical protein ACIRPT_10270 [Streptomyces sp. NPDC101227]|uniref:hypothetical protein n=1 Tax=Streptomyces sp. NPDC101227 TaxID=3366136 RepID=UPI003811A543